MDDSAAICPSHGLPMEGLRPHGLSHARLCPECERERTKRSRARFEGMPPLLKDNPSLALAILFNHLATQP